MGYLIQHILRYRAKALLVIVGISLIWAMNIGIGGIAPVQSAQNLWQISPLESILATPTSAPAPTVPVAAPPPVTLEPPFVVGNPATQTSLPLVGTLIAAIVAVVFLALRSRQ